MKWTRKKPSLDGRYWLRGYGRTRIVVIVHRESEGDLAWRVCDSLASEFGTPLNFFKESDCEWSDTPIPEPNEN